jgi:hypothetical protein
LPRPPAGVDPPHPEVPRNDGRRPSSGQRANEYAHSWSPLLANPGVGNQLEVIGGVTAFAMTNHDISPSPPNEFFAANRVTPTTTRSFTLARLR